MIGPLLNSALTVYRPSFADDGAGGRTATLAEQGTIRAQVSQPSAEERVLAEQAGASLDYVVHTTYGADVQRDDELEDDAGARFRVLASVTNSRHTYKRLECEVVQPGG